MENHTIVAERSNITKAETTLKEVKHAVILAAGNGSRFRAKGTMKPKVLLKVGGLLLLERAILTLHQAGVDHFKIVTGAYREQIIREMKSLPSLKKIDVQYVECEDYNKGNGVSFAAGAGLIDQPFLLTMSDHIFSPETVKQFVEKVKRTPRIPALACDADIEGVFDLDDATKVQSHDGKIINIGKEIPTYDLIDTGLFYFPKGYGRHIAQQVENGACSVSDIINQCISNEGVNATALSEAMWQDVDYPGMRKEAEDRLRQSLIQPTDGWISRNFNRAVSTRITMVLARFDFTPNIVTVFVLLMSFLASFFAASGQWGMIALGGILFQVASILDGCDGELARLTCKKTNLGSWLSNISNSIRYTLFFAALGYSAFLMNGENIYLYGIAILIGLSIVSTFININKVVYQKKKITGWWGIPYEEVFAKEDLSFWKKAAYIFGGINKYDVLAFSGFLFCLLNLYTIVFWFALLIGVFSMAVKWGVQSEISEKKSHKSFLFYVLGFGILGLLIYNMDVSVMVQSLSASGNYVFLVFATAIPWMLFNTMSIYNLLERKVPFIDTLYNQITGDAYNVITPLAGLGGEPYKAKHFSQWVGMEFSSRAIIQDRLVHALSGIFFTSISAFLTVALVSMSQNLQTILLLCGVVFGILSIVLIWLTLSNAPTRFSGYLLKRLKFLDQYQSSKLSAGRFTMSFMYKLIGRFLSWVEVYAIFVILGFSPDLVDVLTVSTFLIMSSSVFVFMPQGLGVNEYGVSTAFIILGLNATVGLTFGLIRRARILFWAFLGLGIQFLTIAIKKMMEKNYQLKIEK